MAKRTIIATSIIALAIMCSPAFAYSNVSPKEPQKVTAMQKSMRLFSAFGQIVPSWTIETGNHRYQGGSKSSE